MEWQPIESAPQTYESVLMWCPSPDGGGNVEVGVRRVEGRDEWTDQQSGEWATTIHPTHWMPFPEPPSVSNAEPLAGEYKDGDTVSLLDLSLPGGWIFRNGAWEAFGSAKNLPSVEQPPQP